MRARLRAWLPSPVAAAVAVGMILSLAGDGHDGFWADHPMLASFISGALLFVAGGLVVERYLERREAQRWAAVSTAAYHDIGHLLDEALRAMWVLHSDPDPARRGSHEWTPAWRSRLYPPPVGPVEHLRALAVFRHELPEPDYAGTALTPYERLTVLLHDREFAASVRPVITRYRDQLRRSAMGWAGLMMWSEHSQLLLNHLSQFAEANLSRVEYHLSWWSPDNAEDRARRAARSWCLTDVKGRVLLNTLWGATEYRFSVPEEVAGVTLEEAFARPDRVGRWRPPPEEPLSVHEYRLENASRLRRQLVRLRGRRCR